MISAKIFDLRAHLLRQDIRPQLANFVAISYNRTQLLTVSVLDKNRDTRISLYITQDDAVIFAIIIICVRKVSTIYQHSRRKQTCPMDACILIRKLSTWWTRKPYSGLSDMISAREQINRKLGWAVQLNFRGTSAFSWSLNDKRTPLRSANLSRKSISVLRKSNQRGRRHVLSGSASTKCLAMSPPKFETRADDFTSIEHKYAE